MKLFFFQDDAPGWMGKLSKSVREKLIEDPYVDRSSDGDAFLVYMPDPDIHIEVRDSVPQIYTGEN